MNKTDKELATEIVCAYLQAWSGKGKTPTEWDNLTPLIRMVYETIQELPDNDK